MANAYAKTRINVTNLEPGENGKYVGDAFVINEININEASTTESGLMSSEDKVALDTLTLNPILKIYKENITVDDWIDNDTFNDEEQSELNEHYPWLYMSTTPIDLPYNVSNNIYSISINVDLNSTYITEDAELCPAAEIEYDEDEETYMLKLYAKAWPIAEINLELIVIYS